MAAILPIDVDEQGVARIAGTRFKIIHLVMARNANGWSPEELQRQFPHLTCGQVSAALSYYLDHKAETDAQIELEGREADALIAQIGETPIRKKLREAKKHP